MEKNTNLTESWSWLTNQTNSGLLSLLQIASSSKASKLTIPSSLFGSNVPPSFELVLTIQKSDSRFVKQSVTVFFGTIPPVVNIVIVHPKTSFLLQSQVLSIQAMIASPDSKSTSSWLLNNQAIGNSQEAKEQVVSRDSVLNSVSVDIVSLVEGSSYVVSLVASDSTNNVSTKVSYPFIVAEAPKYCDCQISPKVGIVLETDFTFSCLNCQNSKGTLDFKYGFIDDKSGTKISLYNLGESYSSKLPAPFSGSKLKCFLDVIDTETGAFTSTYSNITLYKPSVSSISQLHTYVKNWTKTSENYLNQGAFSMSIYQSVSASRTDSVLVGDTLSNLIMRSSKSGSISCSQGVLVDGNCYCKDGYVGTSCSIPITDFEYIQSNIVSLLNNVDTATNYKYTAISQDYLSLISFGIDSALANYKYLSAKPLNRAISLLSTYLEKIEQSSIIELPNGVEKLIISSIESVFNFVSNKKFTSNQATNIAPLLKTIKLMSLLSTRSLPIGNAAIFTERSFFSTSINRNTLFDTPQNVSLPLSGLSVQLPTTMFKREFSGSALQKSFGYSLIVTRIDLPISPAELEYPDSSVTVVSPIVTLAYIDLFVSFNSSGIVYNIPIDQPKASSDKPSPLELKQSTSSYHCLVFNVETSLSSRKKCSLLSVNNGTAQCGCDELVSVYVVRVEKVSTINFWFVILIGLILLSVLCCVLIIVVMIVICICFRHKSKSLVYSVDNLIQQDGNIHLLN